ncbi:MAG: hypothetical protein E5W70_31225 [Mesorhizobium sp.]|uniref:hypothetical protein n=1 Tax=Mesorhizobium sp. TaxID=1871066 RepID=UPI00121BECD1|nr:hypothetical protein [Mesorhizobium sp.]TIT17825.1 MAG: hypothetical protein E5W70_31225 [Mesorhizobium sp.]
MADDLIIYHEGMDYGIGLDSPSADTRNVGVSGEVTTVPNASGSVVSFEMMQISTDEDMQESLGVSVKASGGVGLFSASASMDFARNTHVHSNSVFLLISVKVTLAFSQIKEPILKDDAKRVLERSPDRFQEMYGDSFVRGMRTGGRFFATVEVFTSSKSEQQSLSASVKGSYGLFSAQGSFSTEFKSAMESKSLKIRVYREGGVVPEDPTSLEKVQEIARTFAATVKGNAVPYAVVLDRYSILDLPAQPNYIDLQHQMDVLAYCAKQRNIIWTELNNLDFIFTHREQFTEKPDTDEMATLVKYRADLLKDLDAVTDTASFALDYPKEAKFPVIMASAPEMPKRLEGVYDDLAARGTKIVERDPLAFLIRAEQPSDEGQRGFNIGMAAMNVNTLWGPGAQSLQDLLTPAASAGFKVAATYCLQRNNNMDAAKRNGSVLKQDSAAAEARRLLPPGVAWLGFDIASGLYGPADKGSLGNTLLGPGAKKIRDSLDLDGQRGFDAALDLWKPGGHW